METAHAQTLLLVDDEPNIISALQRLLRRDGYTILSCEGPHQAMKILDERPVDVILSDQRMPGMSGVEFLRKVKLTYPDTVRIVLSGYADLQFITDAINEGAIYKFLTKPWDDDQLRLRVREAFRSKEIADENMRLTRALQAANEELQIHIVEKERQARQIETVIRTLQEVIQLIPWPIVGVDDDGMIALANSAADEKLATDGAPLLGRGIQSVLPSEKPTWLFGAADIPKYAFLSECHYRVVYRLLGNQSEARGALLALLPVEVGG